MNTTDRNYLIASYKAETRKLKAFADRMKEKYGQDALHYISSQERDELDMMRENSRTLAEQAKLTFEDEREIGINIFANILEQ